MPKLAGWGCGEVTERGLPQRDGTKHMFGSTEAWRAGTLMHLNLQPHLRTRAFPP